MRKFTLGFSLLLATTSSVALAQANPANVGESAPSAVSSDSSSEDTSSGGLEEIIVTATRREERLQDIPVSVTAITNEALEGAGISEIRQLTQAVPGFNGGRNFVGLQPTIRGVGSTGVSAGDEPNIAVYVDGIYQPSHHSNTLDLVEVERVEVLRGPQGTIFGRNATGGLINVITPDPKFETSGRLAASYGRFSGADDFNLRAYATTGLSDKIAVDGALLYRNNGGYIDDLVRGGRLGDAEAIQARTKLLFQASDSAKFVLSYSYEDKKDNGANAATPFKGRTRGFSIPGLVNADEPFEAALNLMPMINVKAHRAALRTQIDLGSVSLETGTGFLADRIIQQSDNDASPALFSQNRVDIQNEAYSQEIRLLSASPGAFQWLIGGYGFHLSTETLAEVFNGVAPAFTSATRLTLQPVAHTNALAAFAEGTYAVTDALKITLGARYSWEKRDFQSVLNGTVQVVPKTKNSSDKWTYKAAVLYELAADANLYASYSTGFKSGVFNTFGTSPLPTRPETVEAFEMGLKADPLPWLRTNLALFKYNYDDLQVTGRVPNSPLYLLLNAAKAKIKGAELEVQAIATDSLNIRFSGSLLNARYASFTNAQVFSPAANGGNVATTVDVTGNDMIKAPDYTLTLGADWTRPVGDGEIILSANLFHSAKVYYDFGNRLAQPAHTLLNAQVSWSPNPELRFTLWGTNLTNAVVAQQIQTNSFADFATFERPLEIGVGAQFKF